MLLTNPLDGFRFPYNSFWCSGADIRKRKHAYVELTMKDFPNEMKNRLYDFEHVSSIRRSKKRK